MNMKPQRRNLVTAILWTSSCFAAVAILCAAPEMAAASVESHNLIITASSGQMLLGRVYAPSSTSSIGYMRPGVVLMHGCMGMWSNSDDPYHCSLSGCTLDEVHPAQGHIEKWGDKLASLGYVVLAIDSYTTRETTFPGGNGPQDQCSDGPHPGLVNPYTTRPGDFHAARHHLINALGVNPAGVGVIGWSQGAETTLVLTAETPLLSNLAYCGTGVQCALHAQNNPTAAVAFYPGCGEDLEYGYGDISNAGFWRPDIPLRWNHGESDNTTAIAPCQARIAVAENTYNKTIEFQSYPSVDHGFDKPASSSEGFPTTACTQAEYNLNPTLCARRGADLDSLDFLLDNVNGQL
jgi:dienelactone hydrolase